jgi:ubiquitin C-terminal hydrolase
MVSTPKGFKMRNSPILEEREVTHGDFEMKSIWIQEIMENLVGLYSYQEMEADKKEAIHMILVKLSRILYGNHDHKDHWDDIAGYAQLVSERLKNK